MLANDSNYNKFLGELRDFIICGVGFLLIALLDFLGFRIQLGA